MLCLPFVLPVLDLIHKGSISGIVIHNICHPFQLTCRVLALQSEVAFNQQLQKQGCEFAFDFSPLNMLCPCAQQALFTVMTTKVRKEMLQCCWNFFPQG